MPSSEELIERLDDQSRRYQSVILTLPEWADIRASLHPAPTAADTVEPHAWAQWVRVTDKNGSVMRREMLTASLPFCYGDEQKVEPLSDPMPLYLHPLQTAADTGGLVERLTAERDALASNVPENMRRVWHSMFEMQQKEFAAKLAASEQQLAAARADAATAWDKCEERRLAQEDAERRASSLEMLVDNAAAAIADLAAAREQIATLEDAAMFDRAIFSGECTLRQRAVTRALAAEAERDAAREQIAELERKHGDAMESAGRQIINAVGAKMRAETALSSAHETIRSENAAIAEYLRYCAGNYSQGSDGRNTFVMAAEWVEARAALTLAAKEMPDGQ